MIAREMVDYHDDAVCGSCAGPLECWRDAICETCAPTEEYFELCALMQELVEED